MSPAEPPVDPPAHPPADPPAPGAGDVPADDLHALVDGQLASDRYPAVVDWLNRHPQDLRRVAAWAAQRRALRGLASTQDAAEVPEALSRIVQARPDRGGPSRWPVAASVVIAALVGAMAGAFGWNAWDDRAGTDPPPPFVREAGIAHAVFTPEKRHPVEVAASEQHLVTWLSRRLGQPLKAPDLTTRGYRLLGGRLLPGEPAPRAQFMYEDASGDRVTLFITVFGEGSPVAETSFRSVRQGSRESFYWVEGRFGYALSAEGPPQRLQELAREVYQQLDR